MYLVGPCQTSMITFFAKIGNIFRRKANFHSVNAQCLLIRDYVLGEILGEAKLQLNIYLPFKS